MQKISKKNLLRILDVRGAILGQEVGSPDMFPVVFLIFSRKIL